MATTQAISQTDEDIQPVTRKAYLEYMDFFRSFAILTVVLIHAGNAMLLQGLAGPLSASSEAVRTGLHLVSHNSTIYFALISGVLYAHILSGKPHATFMRTRMTHVALPYAIISIVITLLLSANALRHGTAGTPADIAGLLAYNIMLGEAWNTLWYIPVILVLYLVSPLLMIALNDRRYHWIIAVIILLPLFVSRTGTEVTLSMLTYYCGVYTVGMIIGLNVQPRVDFLNRHVRMAACIALVAAVFIAILDWRHIDYLGFTSLRESGFYVLRLALAALMIVWLYRWSPDMRPETARWLKLIAAWSFGIYFLHGPLLRPIARSVGQFVP
ncbi:MAG: acyltransferase family protein, partial [Sphingomonadaceae bacterium]